MSSSISRKVAFESFFIAPGDVGAAYAKVGNVLTRPALTILFGNSLNKNILVSIDGINDFFMIRGGTQTKKVAININRIMRGRLELPVGTQIYVKKTPRNVAPTSGACLLTFISAV